MSSSASRRIIFPYSVHGSAPPIDRIRKSETDQFHVEGFPLRLSPMALIDLEGARPGNSRIKRCNSLAFCTKKGSVSPGLYRSGLLAFMTWTLSRPTTRITTRWC